jgi:hypothetical protein
MRFRFIHIPGTNGPEVLCAANTVAKIIGINERLVPENEEEHFENVPDVASLILYLYRLMNECSDIMNILKVLSFTFRHKAL